MSKYVLISKDAMCTDYLPVYGNKNWKTPNIDALAQKGTVFKKHYTAAPSTVMSFYSMITGEYGHETKYEMYEKIHDVYKGDTFFTKLKKKGYRCHIMWGDIWMVLPDYFDCYRDDVQIHMLDGFRQGVGAHYEHSGFLVPDEKKKRNTFEMVKRNVKKILDTDEDTFLWIHFPHVINGEVAYGSDIELFDQYVGMIREIVPDECIAFTADHGNMNGHKGKICYGYDVYEPASRIPLITPRVNGMSEYNQNTSSVDLYSILFENKIPEHKFIYSDSAYCGQEHRKLAIIYNHYKYIFNKKTGIEELYDLSFDPTEEFSLIEDYVYDSDRKFNAPSRELYYYPQWDKLPEVRKVLRDEKERIWRNGSTKVVVKSKIKDFIRPFYVKLKRKKLTGSSTEA
ncbi:MAG: sulfatase-like hydrolase/transferase [Lachnospira sp.]